MSHRRRRRSCRLEHMLFSQDGGSAMRPLKYISSGKGESMVRDEKAKRLYSADGETFLGYVLLGGDRPHRKAFDPEKVSPSLNPFSCTFTRGELDLIEDGRSATAAKRREWARLGYTLPAGEMDAAEVAMEKQRVYREVH